MELKRILARDSRSANEKAIQLYGSDVLIISTQRLDNQTELIVAVDLDAQPAPEVSAPAVVEANGQDAAAAPFVPFSKLFQSASSLAPLLPEAASLPDLGLLQEVAVAAPQALVPAPAVNEVEAQAEQLRHDGQRSQEIVEMLRQEIAALRKDFSLSRQMMPWQDGLRLSPAIQQLSLAMSEVGVPAGLRALLTDSIQELESVQDAWPVMEGLLVSALNRAAMTPPESGVHALCGPSGSGKTSMVGRLACAAAQVHGVENQVMVSFADQRPGAWAQMQLLAAQSGVACMRVANSDMLRILLQELEGKTVWIDTCGTDFCAQAELLQTEHPKVLRHAVLPVDATVTSVQKILQNSALSWSSLMLSKVDEAAYPWALIKGLSEQPLGVSCVAGSSRIDHAAEPFDASRLVQLALTPLVQHMPLEPVAQTAMPVPLLEPVTPHAPVRVSHAKKPPAAKAPKTLTKAAKLRGKNLVDEDIVIPTFMSSLPKTPSRRPSTKASSTLKVAHG
ncbi:MAG: Signal recognition particle 54 kDa protein [Pseudomonadota bacterium]